MSERRGCYIVGEGNDGTGKSTQIEMLAEYLRDQHQLEAYVMHEPAGCAIANEIRTIIKNGDLPRDAITNLLLFTASRHETWMSEVKPVLERGGIVLSARNYLSTEIYQGIGEGLEQEFVRDTTARFMDERYMEPDLTVIFDLPDAARAERIASRGELAHPDTFEQRDAAFQRAVSDGYHKIGSERGYPIIDASPSPEEIQQEFRVLVLDKLASLSLVS